LRSPHRLAAATTAALSTMALAAAPAQAGEPSVYNYLIHRVYDNGQVSTTDCVTMTHIEGPDDFGVGDGSCLFNDTSLWYMVSWGDGTVKFRHRATGRYLEQPAIDQSPEPIVTVQPGAVSDNQRWTLKYNGQGSDYNYYSIVNYATGKYVTHYKTHERASPLYGDGTLSQRWALQAVPVAQ
jgi:ricin-type beta-trefoil lectin protein